MTKKLRSQLDAELDKLEPALREAFALVIRDLVKSAQMRALVDAIRKNDTDAALRVLNITREFFANLSAPIQAAYLAGGSFELSRLPALRDPGGVGRVVVRFDGTNPRALEWVRNTSSQLITELLEEQREAVRQFIRAGIDAGQNPRTTALNLMGRINRATGRREGGILGLTRHQLNTVARARGELLSGDPKLLRNYLTRSLRDKRYDAVVRQALDGGKRLPTATVDKLVGRYNDNFLRYRGEVIARTETISAFNAGRQEGFQQLIDRNLVKPGQVTKIWRATGDGRTRDTHLSMDGQTVPFRDVFVSPSGARFQFPQDSSLGAPGEEIIQCRCYYELRVDYLSGAR